MGGGGIVFARQLHREVWQYSEAAETTEIAAGTRSRLVLGWVVGERMITFFGGVFDIERFDDSIVIYAYLWVLHDIVTCFYLPRMTGFV